MKMWDKKGSENKIKFYKDGRRERERERERERDRERESGGGGGRQGDEVNQVKADELLRKRRDEKKGGTSGRVKQESISKGKLKWKFQVECRKQVM